MGSSVFGPGSALKWAVLVLLLGQTSLGLRTAPGSPCESRCSPSNETAPEEVVCLDREYSDTDVGRKFEDCIGCQLQSTFADDSSGQSDVEWGLYNLRFAFTSCVYGYPAKVSDVSNSCPVACEDIEPALKFELAHPSALSLNTWCGTSSFADNEISDCGTCYNLTYDEHNRQVYMANFIEALRYNCHFETPTEEQFPITPSRIFTESMLPSSTADLISSSSTPHNLALIIAMPILGFIILLCLLALGCFFFIRSRRKKVRRLRQSGHLHARWNDTGISTPQWAMEYPAQAQGHPYGPTVYSPQAMYSPHPDYPQGPQGLGFGFGFVDNDGRGQEVGYSKVVEPVITSPSTAYSPEEKNLQAHQQPYFPPPPKNGKMKQPE
ncbi:uncharacterized protein BJX67DRAFT_345061 [Aspergillus lucknowensis]|uniref:Uncharacterized protein n=1 Tax=Aspergillus lucknowensis TaxID=176173 RepID=A0ABR4M0L7_9EURO